MSRTTRAKDLYKQYVYRYQDIEELEWFLENTKHWYVRSKLGTSAWNGDWKRYFKHFTKVKSRSQIKQELAKFYKDHDHPVYSKKYKRCDNVWNWD